MLAKTGPTPRAHAQVVPYLVCDSRRRVRAQRGDRPFAQKAAQPRQLLRTQVQAPDRVEIGGALRAVVHVNRDWRGDSDLPRRHRKGRQKRLDMRAGHIIADVLEVETQRIDQFRIVLGPVSRTARLGFGKQPFQPPQCLLTIRTVFDVTSYGIWDGRVVWVKLEVVVVRLRIPA